MAHFVSPLPDLTAHRPHSAISFTFDHLGLSPLSWMEVEGHSQRRAHCQQRKQELLSYIRNGRWNVTLRYR